jgi:hypothetical protein
MQSCDAAHFESLDDLLEFVRFRVADPAGAART